METFFSIVRAAYLGEEYRLGAKTFKLSPRIVRPYDFSRRTVTKADEYGRLMASLDSRFRDAAGSDLYRRNTGWLDRGKKDCKIRVIEIDGDPHIVPVLVQEKTVAIDTSTINNSPMVLGICNMPDSRSAYMYLEKHLTLPKTHNHEEFHWSKINLDNRQKVLNSFSTFLQIACNALLVIRTDAFISPSGKIENTFSNLVDGCFSGYETTEGKLRSSLRKHLYALTNKVPIHCDADFGPLKPLQVATIYVKRLGHGLQPDPTPTFVNLRSHQSQPIQVADILVGAIRTKLQQGDPLPLLKTLKFDIRKIRSQKGKTASAWFWSTEENGLGKP
jgi:hypothetical protein